MANTKKGGNIIGILVFLIIASIIVAISVVSYNNSREKLNSSFNVENYTAAKVLYDEVMSFNEEDYPQTPEEVMELYNKSYKLIYGNMLKADADFSDILHQQRRLYYSELLNMNSLENQIEQIKNSVSFLRENKIHIIDIEVKPAIYDVKDTTKCYVRIIQQTNSKTKYYWSYTLKLDENNNWKIVSWKATDERFIALD